MVEVSSCGPARHVVLKLVWGSGGPEPGVEVQTVYFVILFAPEIPVSRATSVTDRRNRA
jgi:hypothetical protein